MNRLLSILLLFCVYSHLYAQTPYDAFVPEVSRPILDVVQNLDAYNDSLQSSPMDAPLATQDDVSKWLSPDPLSDKYPEISPYAYCGWNPVKYIDPDGRRVFFAPNVSNSFKDDFKQAVTYMNQKGISGMLYQLETSPNIYYISEGIGINSSEFNPITNTIKWFSRVGLITDNLYEMSPVEVLNHEIDHALQHDTNPTQQRIDGQTYDPNYDNQEEKRVIMGSEQETARKLGKLNTTGVTRNNHKGSLYETTSPTTTEDKWSYTPSNN